MRTSKLSQTALTLTCAVACASTAYAQDIMVDGDVIDISKNARSPTEAIATMDSLYVLDAYLIDKTAPRNLRGGWGKRNTNVFNAGEQIDAVIYLGNVGADDPGQANNTFDLEVFINIRNKTTGAVQEIRPVHTYTAQQPVQTPLEVPISVTITDADATEPLTDLVDLMQAQDPDHRYLLHRCAALFHAKVEFVGRDAIPADIFQDYDAKLRRFIFVDVVVEIPDKGITQDQAVSDALAAMQNISDAYQMRMASNVDDDLDPWDNDVMLRRDEGACTILYDPRKTK